MIRDIDEGKNNFLKVKLSIGAIKEGIEVTWWPESQTADQRGSIKQSSLGVSERGERSHNRSKKSNKSCECVWGEVERGLAGVKGQRSEWVDWLKTSERQ